MSKAARVCSPPQAACHSPQPAAEKPQQWPQLCVNCGLGIHDRYLLKVNELHWHLGCLECSVCRTSLHQQSSCYVKNKQVYCKLDYFKFGTRCTQCGRQVYPNDWVRRVRGSVYHLACFACFACKRQLSTGEEFGLVEGRVLCRAHYDAVLLNLRRAAQNGTSLTLEGALPSDGDSQPRPAKRTRTSFTVEQLQVMQSQFAQDNNPDSLTLQKLAEITGLSLVPELSCSLQKQPPLPATGGFPHQSFLLARMSSSSSSSLHEDHSQLSSFTSPDRSLLAWHEYLDSHPVSAVAASPGHLSHAGFPLPQMPIRR